MLVVTRKKDEKLVIGDDIEVQVLRIGRENVRLGIKAPADVAIYRQEIYDAIQSREKGGPTGGDSVTQVDLPDAEASPEADTHSPQRAKAQSDGRA